MKAGRTETLQGGSTNTAMDEGKPCCWMSMRSSGKQDAISATGCEPESGFCSG